MFPHGPLQFPITLPQPQQPLIYFLSLEINLNFLDFSISGIMQDAFYVSGIFCLAQLSCYLSTWFVHVYDQVLFHCPDKPHFVHQLLCLLGCFQGLTITINNEHSCMSLCGCTSVFYCCWNKLPQMQCLKQ